MSARSAARPAWQDPEAVRAAVTTLLVAASAAAGALTLTEVVWPGPWIPLVLWCLVAVAVTVAAVRWAVLVLARAEPGPGLLAVPSLAGLALLGVLWTRLGTSTDDAVDGAGLATTLRELGRLHQLANESVAPIDATAPVVVAALGATLLLFVVGDALAGPLRAPVAAAAPVLVLWLPALVVEAHVPLASVVVTVVALLCLLAVQRPGRPAGPEAGRSAGPAGSVSGATGVLAGAALVTAVSLVIGGAAAALPGSGSKPLADLLSSGSSSGRLGDDLNVLDDLGDRSDAVVMRLTRTAGTDTLGPLRLLTLTDFDGKTWQPDPDLSDTTDASAGAVLWPGDLPGSVTDGDPGLVVDVQPRLLPQRRVAVPAEPRAVETDARLRYDPVRDEVYRTSGPSTASYRIDVHPRGLTSDALNEQATGFPSGSTVPAAVQRESLAVPHTSHSDDVAALARQITASATTDYQRALLLQTYFRDANRFTYSTRAPRAVTGDPVWDFLNERSGFCVQYATAMAVMLRTLGIPARVGVGYITHAPDSDGVSDVTGRDAHAWPEVYFASSGWVRFEPTPAVQTGAAPSWADPFASTAAPGQSEVPEPTAGSVPLAPSSAPADAATQPATTTTGSSTGSAWSATRVAVLALAGLVLASLGAGAWWRRRSSRSHGLADAEDAWELLCRRLGRLGVTWPDSTTPRQVPGAVARLVRERAETTLPGPVRDSLAALTDALEGSRYARAGRTQPSPTELANLVDDVVSGVERTLRQPKPAARS